jgi:cobalt-zinc-cadmium resistance protein CzcA
MGINFSVNAQAIRPITVEEAIDIALKNNGELKANNLEIQSSQSLKKTSRELPKLNLSAQLGQYNSTKFDQSFEISQTIPFPTLFGAKKQLNQAEVKNLEIHHEISINELKSQIRTYYYQIQYLQHNQIQLNYLDSLYQNFIQIAELRFKTGDIKRVEVSTVTAKKGEINLLLEQNQVYLDNAYQSLKSLMNTKESFEIINEKEFIPLQISTLIDSSSVGNHPLIQAVYQDAKVIESTQKVIKAQNAPDFSIGYVNQSLMGFYTMNDQEKYFNSSKRFNSATIGIAIPISIGSNKAKLKSLDFQKQALESNASQQQNQLATNLQNAMQQYKQDVHQFNYYQNQALSNAKEIVSSAQLGYRTGDISYVEYLYALQTATDIQLNYLKSIQQINQSVVNIYSLINQ